MKQGNIVCITKNKTNLQSSIKNKPTKTKAIHTVKQLKNTMHAIQLLPKVLLFCIKN
jgi:hypothetical protein